MTPRSTPKRPKMAPRRVQEASKNDHFLCCFLPSILDRFGIHFGSILGAFGSQDRSKIAPKIVKNISCGNIPPKDRSKRPQDPPRGPKIAPRGPSSESPPPRTTEKSPWVVLGDFGVVLEPAGPGGPRHSPMLVQAPEAYFGCDEGFRCPLPPRPTEGEGEIKTGPRVS